MSSAPQQPDVRSQIRFLAAMHIAMPFVIVIAILSLWPPPPNSARTVASQAVESAADSTPNPVVIAPTSDASGGAASDSGIAALASTESDSGTAGALADVDTAADSAVSARGTLIGRLGRLFRSEGRRMILLVILVGLLGSSVHSTISFSTYVGNNSYVSSWFWWYMLRPAVAVPMSVGLYLLVQGGMIILGGGQGPDSYGMLALSFLCGMFAQKTADKFSDVFDVIMSNSANEERADKVDDAPNITAITPAELLLSEANAGQAQEIRIDGVHFGSDAMVAVDSRMRAPSRRSGKQLHVRIEGDDLTAGSHVVVVTNPRVGTTSAPASYTVKEVGVPGTVPAGKG